MSDAHLAANQVAEQHAVVEEAIHLYYTATNPGFATRFAFYTQDEVLEERDERLDEAGAASAMMVLASIEAALRVDFLRRCHERHRDDLSRSFRALYQANGAHVRLSEDLLRAWKDHGGMTGRLVSDIRSAFDYRHWLAHGRYYVPKLGRTYDFPSVYNLAREVEAALSVQRE